MDDMQNHIKQVFLYLNKRETFECDDIVWHLRFIVVIRKNSWQIKAMNQCAISLSSYVGYVYFNGDTATSEEATLKANIKLIDR